MTIVFVLYSSANYLYFQKNLSIYLSIYLSLYSPLCIYVMRFILFLVTTVLLLLLYGNDTST